MEYTPSEKIASRFKNIKNVVFVLSGKGGVGKSTFSTQIALTLANKRPNSIIALLDVDVTGPSVPMILNIKKEPVFQSETGFIPIIGLPTMNENGEKTRKYTNLRVMSIACLMQKEDDAVIWRGPKKHSMIKTFLEDVDWTVSIQGQSNDISDKSNEIDFLIIDTPPGTSDEHISCAQLLAGIKTHAIIVTTPQEVSLSDVRREINFCNKLNINILGIVENMSGYACPCCGEITEIFSKGGGKKLANEKGIAFLGSVPIDPNIVSGMDEGKDFVESYKESSSAKAILNIASFVEESLA